MTRRDTVTRRGGSDRGAAVVEAVLLLAVLVIPLTFGFLDLGLRTFMVEEANAGARDGARVAILHYLQADQPGSADAQAVAHAALARTSIGAGTVSVACKQPSGALVPGGCTNAVPGTDVIDVTVTYPAINIFFGLGGTTISGRSAMVVVGLPQ